MDINLIRLFIAAIETNGQIVIDVDKYMSPNAEDKRISLGMTENQKQFVISLADVEESKNES